MKNERGLILVVVVWTLMVLMVMSFELARTMRIEGLTADTYQQEVATYYLALAGFHRAVYYFVRAGQQGSTLLNQPGAVDPSEQQTPEEIWARGDGRWLNEEFGAGGYWVRISDESGKINLNEVEEAALREVFTNLGFETDLGEALTDAILDWRDTDPLVRLNGAESEYYLSLPVPYPAKDGPFDTPDELLLVRGMTSELFYGGLRDVFTVYTGNRRRGGKTNLLTASPVVLQAILGLEAEIAQELVRQRTEASGADLANLMAGYGGGAVNLNLPTVVTIDSIGYLNTGAVTRQVSGVVQRAGASGFQFLRWQDWKAASALPAPTEN